MGFGLWRNRAERASFRRALARDETMALGGALELRVRTGEVLVTQTGDGADHVVGGGAAVRLPGRGRVALWALSAAEIEVHPLPGARREDGLRPEILARRSAA